MIDIQIFINNVLLGNYPQMWRRTNYVGICKQVTEHMFGTLKRQRGFTHALMRRKDNVLGEVGLMFIGYNISRCISILGTEKLIKMLKEHCSHLFNELIRPIISFFEQRKVLELKITVWDMRKIKWLIPVLKEVIAYIYFAKMGFCTDSRCA